MYLFRPRRLAYICSDLLEAPLRRERHLTTCIIYALTLVANEWSTNLLTVCSAFDKFRFYKQLFLS